MSHQRTQIRNAVKAKLIGATDAEDRVYLNPTSLLRNRNQKLPALAVMMVGETVDESSYQTAPRELTRLLDLSVTAYVAGNGGEELSDTLDVLAAQIEVALSDDEFLGCLADDCVLVETDVYLPTQGDKSVAAISLVWRITYREYMPRDAELGSFARATIEYDLGGDGQVDAEDRIELPQ